MVTVTETFFAVHVADMQRATTFYVAAFGAKVSFATPGWTSLHVAGVRVGLALVPGSSGSITGLHFAVTDLAAACRGVERAGGRVVTERIDAAPGVVLAEVEDTEGNRLTLRAP